MSQNGFQETIEKIADAISKLGLTKIAFAVGVVAGGLLWLPDTLLKNGKVLAFRNAHAEWIAPLFWVCAVFVVASFIALKSNNNERAIRKGTLKRLRALTPSEKGLLSEFLSNRTRTLRLPMENPTVVALSEAGIMWRPAQIAHPQFTRGGEGVTYPVLFTINETVWEQINKDADLLK